MVKSATISTATVIAEASSVVFVWSLSGRMVSIDNLIRGAPSCDSGAHQAGAIAKSSERT
jgi:hypothetical protein